MSGSIDGSSNNYFIVAVILTTVVYMFFPIVKIITNHGKLFERKRAKKIALWNSIVVGAIFCIVTSAFIGPWSAAPAFFYYWINSAILTERSNKTADDGEPDKNPTQQPYRCAGCGRMGPYDGDCPDCGSGEIVFLDPETVQAKEDDIDTACEPTPKETAVNDMQREECDTSPDIPAPAKPKIDILPYVTSSVFNPAMRVDTPKESDTSTDITDTSDSTVNASEPMVSKSNVKESNNHSKPIYCTRCGQLIDPETKRCTGCGRRYFSPKPIIISLSAVALIGGIVCFFCFAVPEIRYQQAISYYKQGEYLKANELLQKAPFYKDSKKYVHSRSFTTVNDERNEESIDYKDIAKKRNTDPITSVGEYITNPLGGTGAGIAARSASKSYHKKYPEREETTFKLIKVAVPDYYKGKTNTRWKAHVEDTYNDFINSFDTYTSNYKTDYDSYEDIKAASVGSAFMVGTLHDKGQKLIEYAKMYPQYFSVPDGYNKTGGDYIQTLITNALDTVDRMDKSYEKMLKYVRDKGGDLMR